MDWWNINKWSYYVCLTVNILIQLLTMVKLIKSKKYIEGIKITVLFLFSNLGMVLYFASLKKMFATGSLIWILIVSAAMFLYFGL